MKIIIAIDGYSSCGKSTLAREIAAQMHYAFIDTGAMYRAITLYLLRQNVSIKNTDEVKEALKNITLHFESHPETKSSDIFLNGENVSRYIRDLIVADKVSEVAAIKEVRQFAVAQQQEMGKRRGMVMDGRDIGTVVFPDAELKIFMTADPEIRVKRRFQEMYATNPDVTLDEVRHNLELRDYIDSNREEGPLRKAEDARVLDNSDMTREEQLKLALQWIAEVREAKQIVL
ncbi:(d)CMP kinase [Taibaiella lutea]|uniref:Cytidylate kinase n=1 Tax=Taibaiella lutea TaxID=2608001 RepID=A0A5M6CDK2_9BACT|nr:(d)CMP kinase [Taibaiella lutea]KAA5533181.1 (d)CMP kinase [Taibaiella lutea]